MNDGGNQGGHGGNNDWPRPEGVVRILEGPTRQGSERRWLVELADGQKALLGQLLPELARDEALRRRYVRDAERLRDLDVPALARVLAIGPQPDPRAEDALPPWRLREEPPGMTLEALLTRRAPLPIDEALLLAANLADAVHEVHRRGAVLRDLHPRHVVVMPGGAYRFTDVGLARVDILSTRTAASLVLEGSPYQAPEQLYRVAVDSRADLFSVAVIAWRALTGTLPFGDGPSLLHTRTRLPPLEELRPGVPPGLSSLLARCLDQDAGHRPRSARELSEALRGTAPPGKPTALARVTCQGCGQSLRPGLRLCLHCGKMAVRFSHIGAEGGEPFALDLMKAAEDEEFLRRLGAALATLAERDVPSLNFLVGDARWYSKEERKALLRTPTRLVGRLSEETAAELSALLETQGITVELRAPGAVERQARQGRRVLFGGLGLLAVAVPFIALSSPFAFAVMAVGAAVAVGGGVRLGTARPAKSGPLITLRQAPLALPAADDLVARLAGALTQASPDVREVVSELALLVQRLVDHRATWLRERGELDRIAEPVAPLVEQVAAAALALRQIDQDLASSDEGTLVRALAASQARGEPRTRRLDLLDGLDRLRTLEDERGRLLSRLLEAASLLERAVRLALDTHDPEAAHLREVRAALT